MTSLKGYQIAAMQVLAGGIVFADRQVKQEEIEAQTSISNRFGINYERWAAILDIAKTITPIEALAVVSIMDNEQKKIVQGYLAHIMRSDGVISDSEIKLWRYITNTANLPFNNYTEALQYWDRQ